MSQRNNFPIISYQLFLLHHWINLQLKNLDHYHRLGDNNLQLLQEYGLQTFCHVSWSFMKNNSGKRKVRKSLNQQSMALWTSYSIFFISYNFPFNLVPNTRTVQLPTLTKNDSNASFLREQFFKGWYAKS